LPPADRVQFGASEDAVRAAPLRIAVMREREHLRVPYRDATPEPAQWIGSVLLLTHCLRIARGILLKGAPLSSAHERAPSGARPRATS
jgi:hypothetical protein